MNGKDMLEQISEKEVKQKEAILKHEVSHTRELLRKSINGVKAAKKCLKFALKNQEKSEKAWEDILKKEVKDVELTDWDNMIQSIHRACRCPAIPIGDPAQFAK